MSKSVFAETTPAQTSEEIERFCDEIARGQKCIYVPVKPQPGAKPNCCHPNVEDVVINQGGSPVFGWTIWQSQMLLLAEFHCNWLNPAGELIDITPKVDREARILFLPDYATKWEGRCIPSHRKPHHSSPSLQAFVEIYGQTDEISCKYLPGQEFSWVDKNRYLNLMLEAAVLQRTIEASCSITFVRRSVSIADRRCSKKSQRQRRKQQRRRN